MCIIRKRSKSFVWECNRNRLILSAAISACDFTLMVCILQNNSFGHNRAGLVVVGHYKQSWTLYPPLNHCGGNPVIIELRCNVAVLSQIKFIIVRVWFINGIIFTWTNQDDTDFQTGNFIVHESSSLRT